MKIFLLFILLCIPTQVLALGADFSKFDNNKKYLLFHEGALSKIYIIVSSVEVNANYRSVEIIHALKHEGAMRLETDFRYKMSHMKSKKIYDCNTKKAITLDDIIYDIDGVAIDYKTQKAIDNVTPGSPSDALMKIVCAIK